MLHGLVLVLVLMYAGNTEMEQIGNIFAVCGDPVSEDWPDYKPLIDKYQATPTARLRTFTTHART